MDCKVFAEKVNEYINNELDAEERKVIEEHLKSCEQCRKILYFEQQLDNDLIDLFDEENLNFKSRKTQILESIDTNKYFNKKEENKKEQSKKSYYKNLKKITLVAASFVVIFGFYKIIVENFSMGSYKEANNESIGMTKSDMELNDSSSSVAKEKNLIEGDLENNNQFGVDGKVEESPNKITEETQEKPQNTLPNQTYVEDIEFNRIEDNKLLMQDTTSIDLKFKAMSTTDLLVYIKDLNKDINGVVKLDFSNLDENISKIYFYEDKLLIGSYNKINNLIKVYAYNVYKEQLNLEFEENLENFSIVDFENDNNGSIMIIMKELISTNEEYQYIKKNIKIEGN
ncbi:zf-HC2 domain-containing protein [Clostridium grantii]|uniref:Anti-sigma-W factor RsiW n=1 Tax=Clostridium grantii DSM 8605 TaxID=1121316 RepID=A0A1M5TT87_9CLOT|nr:zf-HC2 domain-containing protein [Clostridium grantii]SHH53888.1 Putative zinc-finger [Clostridium grantii DSM 8605]